MEVLQKEVYPELVEVQGALEEARARRTLQEKLSEALQDKLTRIVAIAAEQRAVIAVRDARVAEQVVLLKQGDEDLGNANVRVRELEAIVREASAAMTARFSKWRAKEKEIWAIRQEAAAILEAIGDASARRLEAQKLQREQHGDDNPETAGRVDCAFAESEEKEPVAARVGFRSRTRRRRSKRGSSAAVASDVEGVGRAEVE